MSFIRTMTELANATSVGGKAAALMRLAAAGFDVPPFLAIEPSALTNTAGEAAMLVELAARLAGLGPGPYAARSSARDEDGADASHADSSCPFST